MKWTINAASQGKPSVYLLRPGRDEEEEEEDDVRRQRHIEIQGPWQDRRGDRRRAHGEAAWASFHLQIPGKEADLLVHCEAGTN